MGSDTVVRLGNRESGWCILRTNGRRTLRLAQSLIDAGIEAWTPRAVQKRRLSRVHMGVREVEQPIMPSFVFARARYLPDLVSILGLPNNPHPSFTIFQHAGRAPVIADGEIAILRAVEERGKRDRRRAQRPAIEVGASVSPTEGAFAGLHGVVEMVKGKIAVVRFSDTFALKVETWMLIGDQIEAA